MDKAELEHRKREGDKAARLYESEQFKDIVQTVRDGIVAEFLSANPNDEPALRKARLKYEALEDVVSAVKKIVDDGAYAAHHLDARK